MTCTNLPYHPRVSCPSLHGLLPFLPLSNVLDIQPGFLYSLTACTFFFFFNWGIADVQYYVSFRCTTKWFTIFLSCVPFIVIVKYWLCLNLREPCWQWLLLSAGSLLRTNRPPHLLNPFESTPIFGFSTQEPTGTVSQTETLLLHPAQINCSWTIDARHFLHLSSSPWMPTPLYPVCLLEMCLQWVCLWHSLAHSPLCSYHFQVTDGIQSRKPKPL